MSIREATEKDAGRLREIYSHYVKNTAITFEWTVPTVSEFEGRIRTVLQKYPYLVYELDGKIVGYAYAGVYNSREGYDWTVSSSIYVDKDYRRMGIGSALYGELEKRLAGLGVVNILAGVIYAEKEDEYSTHNSFKFHIRSGYVEVGHLIKIGKKFDRWYDLLWMQKVLCAEDTIGN